MQPLRQWSSSRALESPTRAIPARDLAEAPPCRQRAANDEYHNGAGTEQITPSAAFQRQQAANDHYHAAAGSEHPTPSTHGSTPSSVAVLAIFWIARRADRTDELALQSGNTHRRHFRYGSGRASAPRNRSCRNLLDRAAANLRKLPDSFSWAALRILAERPCVGHRARAFIIGIDMKNDGRIR